jgi:hypothetical protein
MSGVTYIEDFNAAKQYLSLDDDYWLYCMTLTHFSFNLPEFLPHSVPKDKGNLPEGPF